MAAPTALAVYESGMEAILAFYKAGGTTAMKVNGWEITTANIGEIEANIERWRLTAIRRGELKANINDIPVNVSRAFQRTYQPYGIMG